MNQIRKTKTTIKGGPGGVGIFADKDNGNQIHTHDGSVERTVVQNIGGLTTKTAAFTVALPEDNGKKFELELLTGMDVVLPAVSAANKGMRVTFINALLPTSNVYKLSPASGDRIGYLADDAEYQNTAATDVLGDFVTLESDGVDGWTIVAERGIWAVV